MTQKQKHRRIWLRLLIVAAVLAGLFFGGRVLLARAAKKALEDSYTPFTATIGSISNVAAAKGKLEAINSASYTAQAASKVSNVYVSEREDVRKGQRLLRLNSGQIVEAGFDGRVNRLSLEPGDEVARGDELAQIADFGSLKLTVYFSEYNINGVTPGARCFVDVKATGERFETHVDAVNYISEANGRAAYYSAEAVIHPEGGVYPGMQATLTVPQAEAIDVVVLKESAITRDKRSGEAFVLVKDAEGRYETRSVVTGLTNDNYTQIVSGLEAGETVYAVVDSAARNAGLSALFGGMNGRQQRGGFERGQGNWNGGPGGNRNGNGGNGGSNRNGGNGGR